MGNFSLHHFLADLCIEHFMQVGAYLRCFSVIAMLSLCYLVLAFHDVHHVIQSRPRTRCLMMLSAILGAVKLGLFFCSYGLCIGIALVREAYARDVCVHHRAVAAEIASPEVGTQGVLRHRLFTWLAHEIFRVATATVPHVAGALKQSCARLRRVGWSQRVGMVIVVRLFQPDHLHVDVLSPCCLLFAQKL